MIFYTTLFQFSKSICVWGPRNKPHIDRSKFLVRMSTTSHVSPLHSQAPLPSSKSWPPNSNLQLFCYCKNMLYHAVPLKLPSLSTFRLQAGYRPSRLCTWESIHRINTPSSPPFVLRYTGTSPCLLGDIGKLQKTLAGADVGILICLGLGRESSVGGPKIDQRLHGLQLSGLEHIQSRSRQDEV